MTVSSGSVIVVASNESTESDPTIISRPGGGWIVVWQYNVNNRPDWYYQAYNEDGSTDGDVVTLASQLLLTDYVSAAVTTNGSVVSTRVNSSIAALSDGGWIITRTSSDGSGNGIWQQRYTSTGVKTGSETMVNTTTADDQSMSKVTALASGGWVVSWRAGDGSDYGLFSQVYDASGVKIGGEYQINSTATGDQRFQSVTALAGGGFIVTWSLLEQGYFGKTYARIFEADGSAVGDEFRVDTQGTFDAADVTQLAGGGFVIVWADAGFANVHAILAQVYNADGSKNGDQITITTESYIRLPTVGALDDGGFVVAWGSQSGDIHQKLIHITNDAPVGNDNTVTLDSNLETHTFTLADFGFTDGNGNQLEAIVITTLPDKGTLTLNGHAVSAGQSIDAADLGALVYTPPTSGASGSRELGHFTFQTVDDGGTLSGGQNTDQSPNTFTFEQLFNDAPTGNNTSFALRDEDQKTFTAADFGFADGDGDSLKAVIITTVTTTGSLTLDGVAVSAGQSVAAADIGKLVWTPDLASVNAGGDSFTFQLQDDGGTPNGGADTDASPNTVGFTVDFVHSAPTGEDFTTTIAEDTPYRFRASDFGFSDPDDAVRPDELAAITIAYDFWSNMTFKGERYTSDITIAVTDIDELVFTPEANQHGEYRLWTGFKLADDGDTSNGGENASATYNFLRIDVTSVDDAPEGKDARLTVKEDTEFTFSSETFGFADTADDGANTLSKVIIESITGNGDLMLAGKAVVEGQTISAAKLDTLTFKGDKNGFGTKYASVDFVLVDSGGNTGGNKNTSSGNTLTFDLTDVTDTITGTSKAETLKGTAGVEVIYGLAGNDTLIGGGGADRLDGGAGSDTASYAGGSKAVTASLAKPAINTGDAKGDKYVSIENLTGSGHSDTLTGNSGANVLIGGLGNDTLYGAGGADDLHGGKGKDVFVFKSIFDSTTASFGRDTIFDFAAADTIDISAIDANTKASGNQAFSFIGADSYHGKAGELRFVRSGSDTYVYGDVNGDKTSDFGIHIDKLVNFEAADFVL
ncbi:hypothetical protein [Rhizobium sp. FKL33]|uniref:calcium-binding protein n=1 Tax=Rhizobium sp. FKL33 TaxID=2562307 RepID=UPI0010C0ECFC|nr:hypothetical protein [Rhizobium sp. FKL33]